MNSRSSIYWLLQNLNDCPGDNFWLGEQEKAILNNLRFTKRRSDWRLGRWTAKQAINSFLKTEASHLQHSEIEILADPDGAPKSYLKKKRAPFSISISHSHNVAMCALNPTDKSIGCDIEFIEARDEKFVADYFTKEEMDWVRNVDENIKSIVSNLIWSAKESSLKVLKEGLRLDTRTVNISPCKIEKTNNWQALEIWINESIEYFGWWKIMDGFILTIVAEQKIRPIRI